MHWSLMGTWLLLAFPVQILASSLVADQQHTSPLTLQRRADYCKTTTVVKGDLCAALATRCGISSSDLLKYNPSKDFCNTLIPGQRVCCSAGDLKPHKSDNGTCYTYTIQDKDTCYDIGLRYSLTNDEIDGFNNKTTWYVPSLGGLTNIDLTMIC